MLLEDLELLGGGWKWALLATLFFFLGRDFVQPDLLKISKRRRLANNDEAGSLKMRQYPAEGEFISKKNQSELR
jgi:hypothetical protein